MGKTGICLTVFFEEPFWVGVFERTDADGLSAAKLIFGAEPKDYEVYAAVQAQFYALSFSPTVEAETSEQRRINPKRLQRRIRQATADTGVGTKAQQALKLQYEQQKTVSKARSREARDAAAQRRFALRQEKKKEKHCGH